MIQKTESTYKREIKQVTDRVILIFKLAHDVRQRYPKILKIILMDEQDDEYFLKYFSKQFVDHFFDSL